MKNVLLILALIALAASFVYADSYVTWDNSYTDDNGLKNFSAEACGATPSSVDWNTASWSDDSTNTTNCIDQIRCRVSEDASNWGSYSAWAASGNDLGLKGIYVGCQLNLSPASMAEENCSMSGLSIGCGGYYSVNEYDSRDLDNVGIDAIVTILAMLATVGGLIAVFVVFRYFKKKM